MKVALGKCRNHPEGYAVNVFAGEIKLATVYGATPDEARERAQIVQFAFERDGVQFPPFGHRG